MNSSLTICIPSCRRPHKLKECIEGIRASSSTAYPIIILDIAPIHDLCRDYRDTKDITVITTSTVVGPSKARGILAEHVSTPYLLFLDDDLIPLPNAIDTLHREIMAEPDEIFAGIVREGKEFREAGQIFIEGTTDEAQVVIQKKFLAVDDFKQLNIRKIRADGCMSSLVISKSALDLVSFDPSYQFYYELFDFFLQCKRRGICINVILDAEFDHRPGGYTSTTNRDLDRKRDRDYFQSKWAIEPTGQLGGGDLKIDQKSHARQRFSIARLFARSDPKRRQRENS